MINSKYISESISKSISTVVTVDYKNAVNNCSNRLECKRLGNSLRFRVETMTSSGFSVCVLIMIAVT